MKQFLEELLVVVIVAIIDAVIAWLFRFNYTMASQMMVATFASLYVLKE